MNDKITILPPGSIRSRAVCILGMHRSGTSTVTRAVNLLGVYLGEDAEMVKPQADNPEGFWERDDVVLLQERLLETLGQSWDTTLPLPDNWDSSELVAPFYDELRGLVEKAFHGRAVWGWKDPRSCLLMPLWKRVLADLGVELVVLYVIRHPRDVANSLRKRQGYSLEKACGIWFNYNLLALRSLSGVTTSFVSYDRLLEQSCDELHRIANELSIDWPVDDGGLRLQLREFMRPDLRHSQTVSDALDDLPYPVQRLYPLLVQAVTRPATIDAEFYAQVEKLYREFVQFADFFRDDVKQVKRYAKKRIDLAVQLEAAENYIEEHVAAQNQAWRESKKTLAWKLLEREKKIRRTVRSAAEKLVAKAGEKRAGTVCYQVKQSQALEEKRPRIVHVIANFCTGGSSRLVVDLFERLGHRYEQAVLTQYAPAPPNYIGIPITEYGMASPQGDIAGYLRSFAPTLVHVHYWGACDTPWYDKVFKAAAEVGCKIVENVNTPVLPYYVPYVDHYVFVSKYLFEKYAFYEEKSSVIYPGSDFELFRRSSSSATPDACIGMVYRLEQDKLNAASIDVFIKVAKRYPAVKVLIVGDGSFLEKYKRSVRKAGVEGNFTFTGYVSYETLPSLYEQMSVFVAPVWKESFGQVSPFAMNMAIPVVGYDIGALREIIDDDNLLAPPQDSDKLADIIIDLLENQDKRRVIGSKNQRRAQQYFSVQQMIAAYAKLYREFCR